MIHALLEIALYQPDIPQNVGAMMRLCACTAVKLHIIEPCGFPWDERKIRQAGMDYVDILSYEKHESWQTFRDAISGQRLVLLTTKTAESCYDFSFQPRDILVLGRESAGVPEDVHQSVDARVTIPMPGGGRSLNVVNACAMVLGEALRQTHGFK